MLTENIILRLKALLIYSTAIASIIVVNTKLLSFDDNINRTIELLCLMIIGLNNAVVSKYQIREPQNEDRQSTHNSQGIDSTVRGDGPNQG